METLKSIVSNYSEISTSSNQKRHLVQDKVGCPEVIQLIKPSLILSITEANYKTLSRMCGLHVEARV